MIPVITGRNLETEKTRGIEAKSRHDLLCFCLPTVEPETMRRLLYPSFRYLAPAAEYITVAINFQPPYTEGDALAIVKGLSEYGFRVSSRFSVYPHERGAVPFNRIRNDCAELCPEAKLYALLDDDMSFQEGIAEQYLNMILYMLKYKSCGVGIMEGGNPFQRKDELAPADMERAFVTGKGLLFKPVAGALFPENTAELIGAGEETVLAFTRLRQGMYPAVLKGAKCRHYENQGGEIVGGGRQYGWSDGSVLLREDSCVTWQRSNGKTENGYFDKSVYYAAGGLFAEFDDVRERYTEKILPLEETKAILKDMLEIEEDEK